MINGNRTMYDDVYALSLPSFRWTHMYGPGQYPRWGHTCHLVGNRQMVTVGGSLDASVYNIETTTQQSNISDIECDWEWAAVAILDLSDIKWSSAFNAYASPYQVPISIFSAIGGDQNGGASLTAPSGGFADTAVSAMFQARPTAPPGGTAGTKPGNDRGIIAGAVIGSLAGLYIFIGIIFGVLRYNKRIAIKDAQIAELEQRECERLPCPELTCDWSKFELANEGRIPEMGGGIVIQELEVDEQRLELA